MNRQKPTLLAIAGALVLATGLVTAQSKPGAPVTQTPAPARPNDEPSAKPKLVSPFRGEAPIQYTAPQSKRDATNKFVITTFKVKNVASAPLAGFKVDEFWYDKGGTLVAGAPTFRQRSPIQPNEVITVELRTPINPTMNQPQWKFEHANGTIKPQRVPKL